MARKRSTTPQADKFHAHLSVALTLLRQARDNVALANKERAVEREVLEYLDLSIHDLDLRMRDAHNAAKALLMAREAWLIADAE